MLSLIAFVLMPLSMAGSGASAMGHAMPGMTQTSMAQAATMMGEGDCHGRSSPDEDRSDDMRLSCAVACSLVAPALPQIGLNAPLVPEAPVARLVQRLTGIAPELEAPPPKSVA